MGLHRRIAQETLAEVGGCGICWKVQRSNPKYIKLGELENSLADLATTFDECHFKTTAKITAFEC